MSGGLGGPVAGMRIRANAPLVGRGVELQWLESCLRDAIEGQPRVALIAGNPGIGKTRLVREASP